MFVCFFNVVCFIIWRYNDKTCDDGSWALDSTDDNEKILIYLILFSNRTSYKANIIFNPAVKKKGPSALTNTSRNVN